MYFTLQTQKLAEMENNKRDMDARHKILSSQKCALLEEKCKLQELLVRNIRKILFVYFKDKRYGCLYFV